MANTETARVETPVEAGPWFVRLIYKGQTLRNGRIIPFSPPTHGEPPAEPGSITASHVLRVLQLEPSVDLERFQPLFYCQQAEGWRPLEPDLLLDCSSGGGRHRVEVMLEDMSQWAGALESRRGQVAKEDGFFGIGIYRGKVEMNHGTLWRSAYQMGASFVFSLGARFEKQSTDTMKVRRGDAEASSVLFCLGVDRWKASPGRVSLAGSVVWVGLRTGCSYG